MAIFHRTIWASAACLLAVHAMAQAPEPKRSTAAVRQLWDEKVPESKGEVKFPAGTYAVFHTSNGDFVANLFTEKTPRTSDNFIKLATGKKGWKHPVTLVENSTPIFNGTLFYKAVENALIYGGDPINRGEGDPGYVLEPEKNDDVKFDGPGILAMQQSGSQISGCRFFVTLRGFPEWSGRYTAFGKVVAGLDVVQAISRRPAKRPTVPLDPGVLYSVEILEVPKGKEAVGNYKLEDTKPVLTVSRQMVDAEPTPVIPPPTKAADPTTATKAKGAATSATKAAAPKK